MSKYLFYFIALYYTNTVFSQKYAIKDSLFIYNCDTSGVGLQSYDVDSLKNLIWKLHGDTITPTIYISTSSGQIIKFDHLSTIPTNGIVNSNFSSGLTDIAVNRTHQIYACTSSTIYKVDSITGLFQAFYSISGGSNVALSFDTKNNLYFSLGSIVYRFNNTTGTPVLWHDFGIGKAGGDFVMLNNKMYIAWNQLNVYRLYEVTVDNNINFVSFVDKCLLPDKTYGLASELGQLYGITPLSLFKVNLSTCTNSVLVSNTSANQWYGAAGLHEAQNSVTAYTSISNTLQDINQIKGHWTNTTPWQQTIYIAITDVEKDSIFIYPVILTLYPTSKSTINKTICIGSSFAGYSSTGTYIDHFQNYRGCDSTRTLNLSVIQKLIVNIDTNICQGQNVSGYSVTGNYIDSFKTSTGCDSIVHLNLKVNKPTFSTINKTICSGKIFLNRTQTGTYIDTLTNVAGCDSIRTLNLTVQTIPKPTVHRYTCINPLHSIHFLSQTVLQAGVYTDTTRNVQECDTTYILHVNLVTPISKEYYDTVCQGYRFHSQNLYRDTTLQDTFRSYQGCDSIFRTFHFSIQKLKIQETKYKQYCDTFVFHHTIFSTDTSFIDTIRYSSYPYCDSMHQIYKYTQMPSLNTTILTPNGTICTKGESINLVAKGGAHFLWNTRDSLNSINVSPLSSQFYSVKTWNTIFCHDTAMIWIEVENVVDFDIPSAFSPNNDGKNDTWQPNSNGNFTILYLQIFNRWGEKVFEGNSIHYTWDGVYKNSPQEAGIYVYQLLVEKNRRMFERKGSISLIR